ncbi:MAG: periplasmic protein TonB [Verrucomicrobiota bacterium]|jgi:protein TonB
MFALRIILVAALAAMISPAAATAAENTTAVWSDGHTSSLTDEELLRYAISSPGPGYPQEAQKKKTAGSALYELRINKAGATTEVIIVKSSGSTVLDKAATSAFRKWRFKPAIFTRVRLPVSWFVNPVRS